MKQQKQKPTDQISKKIPKEKLRETIVFLQNENGKLKESVRSESEQKQTWRKICWISFGIAFLEFAAIVSLCIV